MGLHLPWAKERTKDIRIQAEKRRKEHAGIDWVAELVPVECRKGRMDTVNIVICSAQNQDAAAVGIPAIHSLGARESEPKTWVMRAEYKLPEGYTVKIGDKGRRGIYNSRGRHCPLIDSAYGGADGGRPVLVDGDLPPDRQLLYLTKTYDLTFKLLGKGK